MDRTNRELVFCHQCENEWYRDEHGLVCPECTSEFTEVIERDHDPRQADSQPPHPLHTHNPWAHEAPDPDDADIESYSRQFEGTGNQSIPRPPGSYPTSNINGQHANNPMFGDFFNMVNGMTGGRGFPFGGTAAFPPLGQGQPHAGSRQPQPGFTTSGPRIEIFSSGPGGASFSWSSSGGAGNRGDAGPVGFTDILGSIFGPLAGVGAPQSGHAPGQAGPMPGSFGALLQSLMNPANAQHGDAVFTNEAFDRVMSQLMEQHVSGTAPGPASAEAIRALPRHGATSEMMGDNGAAECSICMDNVAKGDEVMILPCKHWFHPPCIEAWLNEHDTCPVCRAGITPKEGPQNTARHSGEQPLHNQDPFELARHQSGRQENPFVIHESPTQARRQRRPSGNGAAGLRRMSDGSSQENAAGPSITDRVRSFFGGGSSPASGGGAGTGR